jgi:hypothetical protein
MGENQRYDSPAIGHTLIVFVLIAVPLVLAAPHLSLSVAHGTTTTPPPSLSCTNPPGPRCRPRHTSSAYCPTYHSTNNFAKTNNFFASDSSTSIPYGHVHTWAICHAQGR